MPALTTLNSTNVRNAMLLAFTRLQVGISVALAPKAPAIAREPVTMLLNHAVDPRPVETMMPLDDCVSFRAPVAIS